MWNLRAGYKQVGDELVCNPLLQYILSLIVHINIEDLRLKMMLSELDGCKPLTYYRASLLCSFANHTLLTLGLCLTNSTNEYAG